MSENEIQSLLLLVAGPAAHAAPARPITSARAHHLMRLHRDCTTATCPCKRASFDQLVELGEYQGSVY